jgi:microcystin-dependent protein
MLRIVRSSLVTVVAAATLVTSVARPAEAGCGTNPIFGEICTFAFGFCPKGFLPATGAFLPIGQNEALFSLLGIDYGGNGTTDFALPDLRGRTTVGASEPGLVGITGGGTGTVSARAATASGGVGVPAAQSPFVGLTRCIANTGVYPPQTGSTSSDNPFVGEIMTFAGVFCPAGYQPTDGSLLSIGQNQAVFQALGTTFGGDGTNTFGVPNLVGATAVGTGQGTELPDVALGQANGNTNTVKVQTATAKSVAVPAAQWPFLTVVSCVSLTGTFPQRP